MKTIKPDERDRHNDPETDLVRVLDELRKTIKAQTEWLRSHFECATKQDLKEMETRIMATQAEIIADLKLVVGQLKKVGTETKELQASVDTLKAKIVELEALIAQGGAISQELVDVVAEVKTLTQTVDDNIPDVPAPPTPPA